MALSKEKQQQIHETRKKQILDAAMELFDTHGYTDTKISDIAISNPKKIFYMLYPKTLNTAFKTVRNRRLPKKDSAFLGSAFFPIPITRTISHLFEYSSRRP